MRMPKANSYLANWAWECQMLTSHPDDYTLVRGKQCIYKLLAGCKHDRKMEVKMVGL